eukprot:14760644-Alexandrium_andersonii.AAC.1
MWTPVQAWRCFDASEAILLRVLPQDVAGPERLLPAGPGAVLPLRPSPPLPNTLSTVLPGREADHVASGRALNPDGSVLFRFPPTLAPSAGPKGGGGRVRPAGRTHQCRPPPGRRRWWTRNQRPPVSRCTHL